MDVGIPVEVEGAHGEFYPGVVYGLNSLEEYKVNLLDPSHCNCVADVTVPPSSMRLPPELSGFSFDPIQGQGVDVLIPCIASPEAAGDSGNSPSPISKLSAWWPGRVKKVGGGFVIVDLLSTFGRETSTSKSLPEGLEVINGRVNIPPPSSIEKTDIVEKHQLRPRSHQPNFHSSSFYMHPIDIPDELESHCKEPSNYQHFARRCGSPVLMCMAPETLRPPTPIKSDDNGTYDLRARLLVISTDVSIIKRAAVIDNTFIHMLRQKVLILQQTEELSKKLEASRVSQAPAPFIQDVYVPENLIPYAIGFQGSNIRRASSIEGVLSIKLNRSTGVFRVSGKTLEAVQQAKAMLDYTIEIVPVPRTYVGPIVGSGQRHIQHIVDCVGLSGMKICDMREADMADFVAFQLTGTSQSIKDARMFLEFHIASLNELDRLRGVPIPAPAPPLKDSVAEQETNVVPLENNMAASSDAQPGWRNNRTSQRTRHRPSVNSRQRGMNNGDAALPDSNTNKDQQSDQATAREQAVLSNAPRPDQGATRAFSRPQNRRPQYNQTNNSLAPKSDAYVSRRFQEHALINGSVERDEGDAACVNGAAQKPLNTCSSQQQPEVDHASVSKPLSRAV